MMHRYSRILVTGGAGFIGSHIVDRLLKKGTAVAVLDNLRGGKFENIKQHMKKKNFSFINGDLRDYSSVERAVKDVDAVIHLAGVISVSESFENPYLYNDVNVVGTLNVLNASLKSNVKRFIYASSCAVYGDPKELPVKETGPFHPNSPYAISKRTAELYVQLHFKAFGLETVCLRFFNVYGPRQVHNQYSGVIIKFLDCLKLNRPLMIFGDGEQTRDFINVQDVVEANMLTLERNSVVGEVFNIGTGVATRIDHLAKTMLEIAKGHSKIIYSKAREGDIRHSVADVSKAKEMLRFFPKVSLESGLRKLIETH